MLTIITVNTIAAQIISLYEVNGLNVDEISSVLGVEAELVKSHLRSESGLFRSRVERGAECDVTRDDAMAMIGVIKTIALDDKVVPATRVKAAIYARDEHFGRNDARVRNNQKVGNVTNNFVMLDTRLKELKAARIAKFKAKEPAAIEVQSTVV